LLSTGDSSNGSSSTTAGLLLLQQASFHTCLYVNVDLLLLLLASVAMFAAGAAHMLSWLATAVLQTLHISAPGLAAFAPAINPSGQAGLQALAPKHRLPHQSTHTTF
jgi:hypothetical protein